MNFRINSRFRDIRLQSAWPVQIVTAHARYHVTCTPMQNLGTFQFLIPTLPIHLGTFIELWWRIRGVYSWDPNLKRASEKFLSRNQKGANFGGFGDLWVRGFKKLWLYSKRHVLAWTHVVWAILRQNLSRGVTSSSRSVGDSHKSKKVTPCIGKTCRR